MNSNFGKGFDFDLGLGSSRPKSLNDQKNKNPPYSSYLSSGSSYSSTQTRPSWQPNKPSWTHQPSPNLAAQPALNGPTSMVGDISGKSWNSIGQTGSSAASIGIVNKNPNLFDDLVGSALGQGKSNSNVPLKNVTPVSNKSSFSMENMANSLPKTKTNSVKGTGSFGSHNSGYTNSTSDVINTNKSPNLGGPSIRSMGGAGGIATGMSSNKDPFGSLVDFGSKEAGSLNSATKSNKTNTGIDFFGDFQNASKSNTTTFPSSGFSGDNIGLNSGSNLNSNSQTGDFGIPTMDFSSKNQTPVQHASTDPLDMLFSSSSGAADVASGGFRGQESAGIDDWGLDSEFGGSNHDMGGSTTELEGLPPPPAGVTASSAKNKGMDNYKQGQYADAIKWLSWAIILLEKGGDNEGTMEVLSSRASCYKEVGEYKKAVADCTKVLEHNDANVSVLVQRALLYESMEKYKLGAEDLRTVLNIDPTNRVARSTVHRLTQMVG